MGCCLSLMIKFEVFKAKMNSPVIDEKRLNEIIHTKK